LKKSNIYSFFSILLWKVEKLVLDLMILFLSLLSFSFESMLYFLKGNETLVFM
tara:strand:- start:4173 stop:4331 length:159 start_codon:yes stop_codon:yes gene_type:complete